MQNANGILLISEDASGVTELQSMLTHAGYIIRERLHVREDIISAAARCRPDVIVAQLESIGMRFLNQLYNLNQENPIPIVIFTDNSESTLINDAIKAGVSAFVVDGLSSKRVKPIIEIACARFSEHQVLRDELAKTKSKLDQRKAIERAKGIIMRSRNLNEEDAYKALRKLAMDKNKRLVDVANDVISVSKLLV